MRCTRHSDNWTSCSSRWLADALRWRAARAPGQLAHLRRWAAQRCWTNSRLNLTTRSPRWTAWWPRDSSLRPRNLPSPRCPALEADETTDEAFWEPEALTNDHWFTIRALARKALDELPARETETRTSAESDPGRVCPPTQGLDESHRARSGKVSNFRDLFVVRCPGAVLTRRASASRASP